MDKISKHNLYVLIVVVAAMIVMNLSIFLSGVIQSQSSGNIISIVEGSIAFLVMSSYIAYMTFIMPLWINKETRNKMQMEAN